MKGLCGYGEEPESSESDGDHRDVGVGENRDANISAGVGVCAQCAELQERTYCPTTRSCRRAETMMS
jgi:hypothetical protein